MGIILEGEDEAKLQDLVSAMQSSRTTEKSMYASSIRHFEEGEGRESDVEVEALILYRWS